MTLSLPLLLYFSSLSTPLFSLPPHRLISLAPDITEILYALELEQKIVAVSDYSDFPRAAKKKPGVGSFVAPNIERILFFKPDLVFAREGATPPQLLQALEQTNIEILSFAARDEKDIYIILETIGKKFKKEKKATQLIWSMKSELAEVDRLKNHKLKKKPRVLIQLEEFPMIVAGRDTLLDRAIELAGGINAAKIYSHYPKLQLEAAYQLKPELIIIPVTVGQERKNGHLKDVWKSAKGIRGIYEINADLISRASPRFSQGVKQLANIFALRQSPPRKRGSILQ